MTTDRLCSGLPLLTSRSDFATWENSFDLSSKSEELKELQINTPQLQALQTNLGKFVRALSLLH